jgi:hypothetical protein
LRSNHTKLIPQKESVKNTHKTSHLSDKVTHQKESVKKATSPKIGDAPCLKATKNPIPSDKVTHQGTTAAKACCVGTDPSQKVGKKTRQLLKGSYLFSKAKASQNRSEKQPHLVFNLQSPPNPQ